MSEFDSVESGGFLLTFVFAPKDLIANNVQDLAVGPIALVATRSDLMVDVDDVRLPSHPFECRRLMELGKVNFASDIVINSKYVDPAIDRPPQSTPTLVRELRINVLKVMLVDVFEWRPKSDEANRRK